MMFYIDQQRLLHGSRIILNWHLKQEKGIFILWIPISRFFWNNYSLVKNEGNIEMLFSGPVFKAKIKIILFFNFKTVREISEKTRNIIVKKIDVNATIISTGKYSACELSCNKLYVHSLDSNISQKGALVNSMSISIKNLNYLHKQL